MTPLAEGRQRPYRSALREAQAEETRTRILDAALRVMATGLADLSVPAVALEAGVSVATVYRHFRTKRELVSAAYPHAVRRAGLETLPEPRSVEDLRPLIHVVFERLDALDDASRAAMASPFGTEVRHATIGSRLERIGRMVDSMAPNLGEEDRARITRLLVVLTASASLRMWREHLELSVDQVADDIEWIVRAAAAAAENRR